MIAVVEVLFSDRYIGGTAGLITLHLMFVDDEVQALVDMVKAAKDWKEDEPASKWCFQSRTGSFLDTRCVMGLAFLTDDEEDDGGGEELDESDIPDLPQSRQTWKTWDESDDN